ncbi:MAG: cytochrome C-type biosis protein CcmH [Pseudomonadota bacterium]|jgi:cytochrome c-type biogenesis protein CcmH
MKRLLPLFLALMLAGPAGAVLPDEKLADPALEARAREISKELRCLVCQNESIDASNAPLARDLRLLVRERLVAGDSDDQALAHIHARYGDFVLLRPPVKPETWPLWFGPGLILVVAAAGSALYLQRRRRDVASAVPTALTAEEEVRLAALLDGLERDGNGPDGSDRDPVDQGGWDQDGKRA